jgi:hypothetical protein
MLGSRIADRIDLGALIQTAKWLEGLLERQLPGMLMKAGLS